MVNRRAATSQTPELPRRRPRATTPEAREQEMVALAFDVVEKRMRAGTASSQETTHFLKLGSSREYLEQERLKIENGLNKKKIEIMDSQKRVEELYKGALDAMRSYSGDPIAPPDLMEEDD